MVNTKLTTHTIVPKSEGQGGPSDIFIDYIERAEWAWLKKDEEFDFE